MCFSSMTQTAYRTEVIFLYLAEEIDGKWHKIVHDIFNKFARANRFF